jgi:5-methylthioadenosine/S-adenosylhomocysteine deaminase
LNRILFHGIALLPMTRPQDVLPEADLLVEDGAIVYAGPQREWLPEEELEIFDGRGKVVMPGFINAHTHLAMVFLRGYGEDLDLQTWLSKKVWPMEAKLKAADIYIASLLGAAEMIASGTTCFADMYFHMDQVAKAVDETGLRASLGFGMVGVGAFKARTTLEQGLAFAKTYDQGASGRITTMLAPHSIYTCPPDFLERATKVAEREGLRIHIHLSETKKEVNECLAEYGKTPVALLDDLGLFRVPTLAAHCVVLEEGDYSRLRKVSGVAHCQVSNMKLSSGICPTTRLLREGVNVALGTDGASSNNRLEMLQEVKLTALVSKAADKDPTALPAFQVLQMATLGGARALGLDGLVGTLEVGKRADLVVYDFDAPHLVPCFDYYSHIAYAALPSDVHSVMVEGRWLYKDHRFLTLDREAVLREARERTEDLA